MAMPARKASRVEKTGSLWESPLPNNEEEELGSEFEHIVAAELETLYVRIRTAHRNELAILSKDGKKSEKMSMSSSRNKLECVPPRSPKHAHEDGKWELQYSEAVHSSVDDSLREGPELVVENSSSTRPSKLSKASTKMSQRSKEKSAKVNVSRHEASISQQLVVGVESLQEALRAVKQSVIQKHPNGNVQGAETILSQIVHSPLLNHIVAVTIFINALTIAVQTEWRAQNVGAHEPMVFDIIDHCCIAIFIAELSLKLALYRGSYFINKEYRWNCFDFLLVVVALVELMMTVLVNAAAIPGATLLRSLRLMRIVRTVRALRVAAVFRELRMMINGILNCSLAFSWLILLLAFVMFVCSVFITHGVTDQKENQGSQLDQDTVWLDEHFGSLARSFYSLFKMISDGQAWGMFADRLFRTSPLSGALLLLYVAFVTFAVLNIVTGIFVNFSMKAAEEDVDNMALEYTGKRAKLIDDFCIVFNNASNASGFITLEHFRQAYGDPRVRAFFHFIDLDVELYTPEKIFQLLDFDGDQTIDLKEFVTGLSKFRGSARALDLAALHSDMMRVDKRIAAIFKNLNGDESHSDSNCSSPASDLALG